MRLIDQGMSNKDIARHLGIGVATAKSHVHHILEKLNVRGRSQAAARLRQIG
jgi:DNA-binding NarL/FixJ family response regulator